MSTIRTFFTSSLFIAWTEHICDRLMFPFASTYPQYRQNNAFVTEYTSAGRPLPVKVSLPAVVEEDEDEAEQMSAVKKGKRKAGPEDLTSDF